MDGDRRGYSVVSVSGSLHPRIAGVYGILSIFVVPITAIQFVGSAGLLLCPLMLVAGIAWLYATDRREIRRLESIGVATSVTFLRSSEWGDGNTEIHYVYQTSVGERRHSYSPGYIPWRHSPTGFSSSNHPNPGDRVAAVYDPGHPDVVGWLDTSGSVEPRKAPTIREDTAVILVAVAVGIGLLWLVSRAYNDPATWGWASGALFFAFMVACFAALPVLNGGSWFGSRPRPLDRLAAVILVELVLAFAVLTQSPLNH